MDIAGGCSGPCVPPISTDIRPSDLTNWVVTDVKLWDCSCFRKDDTTCQLLKGSVRIVPKRIPPNKKIRERRQWYMLLVRRLQCFSFDLLNRVEGPCRQRRKIQMILEE